MTDAPFHSFPLPAQEEINRLRDEIDRLAATAQEQAGEIERLRAELDAARAQIAEQAAVIDQARQAWRGRVQEIEGLREAAKIALRVFVSLAERGHYPAELLPDTEHFIGEQGFAFLFNTLGIPLGMDRTALVALLTPTAPPETGAERAG